MFWLVLTLLEVDVGKCIKLVHDDVDVVATDACAQHCDALTLVGASNAVELAALYFAFLRIEMSGNSTDPTWVADKNDAVCKLFGLDVKVEDATILIDNEF